MPRAAITLRGIDRDVAWHCVVRMRGARPSGSSSPEASLGIDGLTMRTVSPGVRYEDVPLEAPARPGAANLALTLTTTPPFVPGNGDQRELGVQVDRISCAPLGGARVLPPTGALRVIAVAGAAFGALFAMLLPTLMAAVVASTLFSAGLAFVVDSGFGAYASEYLSWIPGVSLWFSLPVVAFGIAWSWSRRTLHPATGFVLAFSSAILVMKVLTLLHPSKDLIDAVFHANRLKTVIAGNYYFTQPMPGGVRFPYAIGLYVTAMPWANLLPDHVALLRIVVCVAEAVAAALLYLVVVRNWNDRLAGGAAVVLYHFAPLPYIVVGNANLTYAFGQSIAVITLVAAATLRFRQHRWISLAGLFALASLAFLSHVGVFPVLAVTLVALGLFYAWLGGADLRAAGRGVLLATVLAAVFAIGAYYAHFPEVYRTLGRVSAPAVAPQEQPSTPPAARAEPLPVSQRVSRAVTLGVRAYGLPLLALAAMGLWLAWRRRWDPLTLAIAACGCGFLVFAAFRVAAPVDARLQRYADEFIDRLYYASLPAAAILAAYGAAWCWRAARLWRLAATGVLAASAYIAVRQWMAWIR